MVLYDIGLVLFRLYLAIAALFNPKIRAGIKGRKGLFKKLETCYYGIQPSRKRILVHVSSYGELEQAKPVIEALKTTFPEAHLHLTFFSPSGYINAAAKYSVPDLITYLPLDTKGNMRRFLDIVRPNMVLFCRYDVWHNFARELEKRTIPSILFSATFGKSSVKEFPLIKSFLRKTYSTLSKIFCVSDADRSAFIEYGIHTEKLVIAGDTRYDQVVKRRNNAGNKHMAISSTLHDRLREDGTFTIVAGSTWSGDEQVMLKATAELVDANKDAYLIIAPHEISEGHLVRLERELGTTSRLSFYNGARIIIADSVGLLFDLYRYADIAYVGGGFGAGVHNVLEPAVWGAPVIIGPEHSRSQEVQQLIGQGCAFVVSDAEQYRATLASLYTDQKVRQEAGDKALKFVEARQGACDAIVNYVRSRITLRTSF